MPLSLPSMKPPKDAALASRDSHSSFDMVSSCVEIGAEGGGMQAQRLQTKFAQRVIIIRREKL